MAIPVRFNSVAADDLDAILRFISADSLANATAFVDRIEERCMSLGEMPYRGRQSEGVIAVRELVFERRVVIVYRVEPDQVIILRIRYGGREQ